MLNLNSAAVVFLVSAALQSGTVSAQNYPNRPIRILTSEAGGGSDSAARTIAQGLGVSLGQQVVVENRGGGVIAGEIVSRASPDGYTLLYYGNTLWILPLLRKNIPYDTVKDFAPVTWAVSQFSVLVVHPSLPVKSVKDLIALAKARPGLLNYGSGASGGSNHLAAELFKSMAGVDIVRIPFKSTGPANNALMGGEIQMMFTAGATVMPHVKSRKLRALAISAARPSAVFPDLPTISNAGLPGFETAQISGMFAPVKTPAAIVDRLHQEIARVLERQDVKDKFANFGVEAVGGSPDQFAATIKSEMSRMGKVIRDAGIRDE